MTADGHTCIMLIRRISNREQIFKEKMMCQMVEIKTNFDTEIRVAEIKKEVIENIIEAARACALIGQIILFGSAIESRCTENSDVDMLVISDTNRSKLYRDKSYQEFLRRLHDRDNYEQMYDVICVHGLDEVYQKQGTVDLFREVIERGKHYTGECEYGDFTYRICKSGYSGIKVCP